MNLHNTVIVQPMISGSAAHAGEVSTALMPVPAGEEVAVFLETLLQQYRSKAYPLAGEGAEAVAQSVDGQTTDASGKFLPSTDALTDQVEDQGLTSEELAEFLAQFVPQSPQPEASAASALVPLELTGRTGASSIPQTPGEDPDRSESPAYVGVAPAVAATVDRPAAVQAKTETADAAAPATGIGLGMLAALLKAGAASTAEFDSEVPGFASLLEKSVVGPSTTLAVGDQTAPVLNVLSGVLATHQQTTVASAQKFAAPLDRPVGQSGWSQDLGERVLWMAGQGLHAAELRLNPPHLGPLEVRVKLDQDQTSIQFVSHHASVREAIESAIPKLREMLGAQQLGLMEVSVSQQSFADQRDSKHSHFDLGHQSQSGGSGQASAGEFAEARLAYPESEPTLRQVSRGLLSLYA